MERTKIAVFASIVGILLLACAGLRAEDQSSRPMQYVVANAALALPAGSDVKVRWVCPPLDPKAVDKASWYSLCFAVDTSGKPWIGYQEDSIACPTRQYRFKLPLRYSSLVCLDNGALLAATDSDLCFIVPPTKPDISYDNIPNAQYQPIMNLPVPNSKLYAGSGNNVYFVSSRDDGGSDVYLLVRDKIGPRRFDKIFSSKSSINAVTGDGAGTFVAMRGAIAKISGPDKAVTKTYANDQEFIRGLAYLPGTGLFYCTDSGVSYIGAKGRMQLIAAPNPRICLQNGTLYVMFSKSLGVLALDDIASLKKFDRAVKSIPVADSKYIKINSVRFFEAGKDVPEMVDRKFAIDFDHDKTRFVYCQVDITNLQYKKLSHKQTLSMELYRAGDEDSVDKESVSFDVKPSFETMWGWVRFGAEDPGNLYPGTYVVKTRYNGTLVDESKFTVSGEPTLAQASGYRDVAEVTSLIKAGADVNAAGKDGITPLMLAAYTSDAEIVKLLIAAGANVNAKRDNGDTALTMDGGNWKDDPAVSDLLIKAGADVNAQNNDGETALHKAVYKSRVSVVKTLLEHGAKTDIKDKDGDTPLFAGNLSYSDAMDTVQIVDLFLTHGADTEIVSKYGNTLIFFAIEGRNKDLLVMLIKRGANVNATGKIMGVDERSVLGYVLDQYQIFGDSRLEAAKLKEIAKLIQDAGADLNATEFDRTYYRGVEQILDQRHFVRMLEMSQRAAEDMQPSDPALRKADIRGLLNAACRQISAAKNEDPYYTALNLCEQASDRAKKWGLISGCAEIYFNMGIIYNQLGSSSEASKCLQEYLDLAPTGTYAAQARELMSKLQ